MHMWSIIRVARIKIIWLGTILPFAILASPFIFIYLHWIITQLFFCPISSILLRRKMFIALLCIPSLFIFRITRFIFIIFIISIIIRLRCRCFTIKRGQTPLSLLYQLHPLPLQQPFKLLGVSVKTRSMTGVSQYIIFRLLVFTLTPNITNIIMTYELSS